MTEVSSLTGRLLVATPALADPNFDRAVVLLLDHDEEGSLGVVLNRPTPVGVADILESWGSWRASPVWSSRAVPYRWTRPSASP